MQQQIDLLQTANMDLSKKVQALTQQVNNLNNDMNQVKQILPQLTSLMTAHKTTMDQFDAAIKELQAKATKGKKKK